MAMPPVFKNKDPSHLMVYKKPCGYNFVGPRDRSVAPARFRGLEGGELYFAELDEQFIPFPL